MSERVAIDRQVIELVGGPHDGGMFCRPDQDGYPVNLYFAHNRRECSEVPIFGHPYRYVLLADSVLARYQYVVPQRAT